MKKIICFLFICLFIINGCSCSFFEYKITFVKHDGVVSTSCDKKDCVYSKGDKATITIEFSKHYNKISRIYANKTNIDGKRLENIESDEGNYFVEFTIDSISDDIKITYPNINDFYELTYTVKVIPDTSYAGSFNQQVDNLVKRSIRANFLYGFKVIKDDEVIEDTKERMTTFGEFFDDIMKHNGYYKVGDVIEVYVKSAHKDEEGNSAYDQYLENFASLSYGRTLKYPLDVSYDRDSNITTYRLVVKDSGAFEILGFSNSSDVAKRILFDGVNLNGKTDALYDSEPIKSFKIYTSNNEEVIELQDVEETTKNDTVRIEVEFVNETYKKIIKALKDNLILNGEKIETGDYEVTSEGKLIINNVRAPYDYDKDYRGYYNSNEIGHCYQIELTGVEEYVNSNENFRKLDFDSLMDSWSSEYSFEKEYSFVNGEGMIKLNNVYYYDKSEKVQIYIDRDYYADSWGALSSRYFYRVTINDKYIVECNEEMEGVVQDDGFVIENSFMDEYVITIPSNFENIVSLKLEKFKSE